MGVRLTLLLTNLIKLAGLIVALHAAFGQHPSPVVLALSGFMMAGAQLGEATLLAIAKRFFVIPEKPETPPPESKH